MSQTEVQLIKADAVQTADIANSAVTDAKISALTSSKLTGALPAISGASLTNLPASGKAHNLVINGAMQVAQRGTSSTADGYGTVDRFTQSYGGTDEAPTQAQADVASGTTPYTLGFRKAFKITNGNQTGGAGTADVISIMTFLEAQDIANSGWNYVSTSSYITLSFWVKSSVAQNFYFRLQTEDGTTQNYPMETGSLSANTWTKITKTIPGNSNLQFDNNANSGLIFDFSLFRGTDRTGSVSLNAWAAYNSNIRTPDNTSTWYTTNDATFEITGVQLEVGDSATDFEHKSFGEELALCQRYFEKITFEAYAYYGYQPNSTSLEFFIHWNVEKRSNPSITLPTTGTSSGQLGATNRAGSYLTGGSLDGPFTIRQTCARISGGSWSGGATGDPCALYGAGPLGATIKIDSEL